MCLRPIGVREICGTSFKAVRWAGSTVILGGGRTHPMIRFEKRLGRQWRTRKSRKVQKTSAMLKKAGRYIRKCRAALLGVVKTMITRFKQLFQRQDMGTGHTLALSRVRVLTRAGTARAARRSTSKRAGYNWNTYVLFFLFALTAIASVMMGCRATPFNSECKAVVNKFEPEMLRPTVASGGANTLPRSQVEIAIYNRIALHLRGYSVGYYGPDGTKIIVPALSVSASLGRFIKPDEGVATEILDIEIYTEEVYEYISQGTPEDVTDDINPVTAVVTFTGEDENGNPITFEGSVVLDTTSD